MAKKNHIKLTDFAARGVSFPKKPFHIEKLAEEEALRQNRSFSSYIVGLILRDLIKKGRIKNG